MIRAPRYKICRMVGDAIYPQCQTAKFAASSAAREGNRAGGKAGGGKRFGGKSEYGMQLTEKQKARYTYGITERQFSNEVKNAHENGGKNAALFLWKSLESRLDNVVFRLGLASSRAAARQMVSHGHITVDGTRVTTPSYKVAIGEKIAVRGGSRASTLFQNIKERTATVTVPAWLAADYDALEAKVLGEPVMGDAAISLNLPVVLEFYSRA